MKRIFFLPYFIFLAHLIFNHSIIIASAGANKSVSLIEYEISASESPASSGTVTGAGRYNRGSRVTLVATANAGYLFTNWTERGKPVSTSAIYSFTVTKARTLVANFTLNVSVISVSANPIGSGNVTGGGTFTNGSNVTISASPNPGFYFKNWTEGSTIVSSSPSFSFVVRTPRSFVANFANNPPSASNLSITGDLYVCKKLTGLYTYSDLEGDPEQGSTFRWYLASTLSLKDTVFITGATGITYTLTDAQNGKYIYFKVTPRALTGATTGTPVLSSPTALISKSTPLVTLTTTKNTTCLGQSIDITMTFSGTPPYRLVYTDGSAEHTITTSNDIYTLTVTKAGSYKGDTLTDSHSCPITVLPSTVQITVIPVPAVKIVGLNSVYSLSSPPISLQGTPTGGTFSGDGVVPSSNLFYPSIAGVAGSPHPIVYTYTSSTTGCINRDTVNVNVVNAEAFINGLRTIGKYCNYDVPFIIRGGNSSGVLGKFSITGGVGLTDHGDNTATINPSILQAGSYVISYTYFNNVSLTFTQSFTVENFAAPVILGVNQSFYCSNNARMQLSIGGNSYSGGIFSGNGVGKNSNGTYYFDPLIAIPGRALIKFIYATAYGCNVSDSVVVQVSQPPQASFVVQNFCWKGDSTTFKNLTQPANNVNYWEWHYGDDAAPESKNTSNKFEQKHLYPSYGNYWVMLIARNTNNCSDTIQKNIHLGDIPIVNFNWKSECFVPGAPVRFNNLTINNDAVVSYRWVVKDALNATFQFITKNMQYTYPGVNNYPVKLVVTTETGCKDSIIKTIPLRPVYSLRDSSYFKTFEVNQGYWYPGSSVNNWKWGTPGGSVINSAYSGNKALYTSFGSLRKNEQLVVTSPCYDFTGVAKPFIQMWVNVNSTAGQEGAVLQYAVDTVLQWANVGKVGSGINWYNDNSISVAPGGQVTGWSGTTGWVQARNNLDILNGLKYIRFRMVYGSNPSSTNKDGFAFDDVFIGRRSKTVLFEHFTDMSSTGANQSDVDVDNILESVSGDAVGIQYHTSFKAADTLTSSHSAARVLYYGDGNIPQCYLDGGIDTKYVYNFSTQKPNINDVYTRTLKDADYDITINKDKSSQQLSGTVIVKALNDIAYREVLVYIAVVEDIKVQLGTAFITYKNVLKTLLPSNGSSLGYYINSSLLKNQEVNIPYTWSLKNVYNAQNLKLVVFIQDNNNKEVYQAAGITAGLIVDVPQLIDPQSNVFEAVVYPNPVKDRATVVFGKELLSGFEMTLIDQAGKLVKQVKIMTGVSAVEFEISDLHEGLYFIRIYNTKTGVNKSLKMIVR